MAAVLAVVALSAFAARTDGVAEASTLTRDEDPVVLTGADVPTLAGIAPNLLVAFRYTGSTWVQIPVQVDERDIFDFADIYNGCCVGASTSALQYTDANTWVGPDRDASIDGGKDGCEVASLKVDRDVNSGDQLFMANYVMPGQCP
jgi:hypothetical protein